MPSLDDFIRFLHGTTTQMIFRAPEFSRYSERMTFKSIRRDEIEHENRYSDIYFVPNIGGTRDAEINRFTSLFIDLDCGRTSSGRYHDTATVDVFKSEIFARLRDFTASPSIIVDSRNGLHIYWKLAYDCPLATWKSTMTSLIDVFGADPAVRNPAHLMRAPLTNWIKPNEGLPRYPVRFLLFDEVDYHVEELREAIRATRSRPASLSVSIADATVPKEVEIELLEALGENEVTGETATIESSSGLETGDTTLRLLATRQDCASVNAIIRGDVLHLRQILRPSPVELADEVSAWSYICREVDLGQALQVDDSHRCLFHPEDRPSASIFRTRSGELMIRCHSSRCGFLGNLIRCVGRLRGSTDAEAYRFLRNVLMIRTPGTTWVEDVRYGLDHNQELLCDSSFQRDPDLRFVNAPVPHRILDALHRHAARVAHDAIGPNAHGEHVFFATDRFLSRHADVDLRHLQRALLQLAFLRMITRVSRADVPERLLEFSFQLVAAQRIAALPTFYSIPVYTSARVEESRQRARLLRVSPLRRSAWCHEGIYRSYGAEIATELFPNVPEFKPSRSSELAVDRLQEVAGASMTHHGWASEVQLVTALEAIGMSTARAQSHYDKTRIELLGILDAVEIRLTKSIAAALKAPSTLRRAIVPKAAAADLHGFITARHLPSDLPY